jgi:hypothetical protein
MPSEACHGIKVATVVSGLCAWGVKGPVGRCKRLHTCQISAEEMRMW